MPDLEVDEPSGVLDKTRPVVKRLEQLAELGLSHP
jgi:hypothetical protein